MYVVVTPYLKQCAPPEFSATLPATVQTTWEDGSGSVKVAVRGETAAVMAEFVTPGSDHHAGIG